MQFKSTDGQLFGFPSEHEFSSTSPAGAELVFDLRAPIKLVVSPWTGELKVRQSGKSASFHALALAERKALLLEFFQRWSLQNPEAAKKNAFDYIDGQKGFLHVAFIACVFFTLPMAVALLADSHQQFSCTKVLQNGVQPGTMQVVKTKKRDSKTYLLNLEFVAPNGKVVRGQEDIILPNKGDPPKSFPILFSPEQPECWSLTKDDAGQEVLWAKRRYYGAVALLFGAFFLAGTIFGLAWIVSMWIRPRPFADEVRALFKL